MAFGAHPFALVALVLDLFLATLVLQQHVPVLERLSASVAGHIVSTVVIFFVLLKSHLPNRLTTLVTEKVNPFVIPCHFKSTELHSPCGHHVFSLIVLILFAWNW